MPVVHNWEIAVQDTADSGFIPDDLSWNPIDVPRYIFLPQIGDARERVVWIRGVFTAGDEIASCYGVAIGRVRFYDEVYINKSKIGSGAFNTVIPMPLKRYYVLPGNCGRNLIHKGENFIAVRVRAPAGDYIGLDGGVSLLAEKEFIRAAYADDLLFRIVPAGIIILFFSSALSLLILYFLNRRDRLVLISLVADLAIVAYLTSRFVPFWLIDLSGFPWLYWSGLMVFSCITVLMTQSVYRVYFTGLNVTVVPLVAGAGLVMFPAAGKTAGNAALAAVSFVCFFSAIVFSAYISKRFHHAMHDAVKPALFWSIISFMALIIIAEIIIRSMGLACADLVILYGSPVVILLFHALLGRDYMAKTLALEKLYGSLREKAMKTEIAVTETAAEKLERVIEFIKNNYTSDISREGLAAAVDMNHNYMSRIFKAYTGQKINEYITGLRIIEAGRRLVESDMKIIDIALLVGFDSLTTFNRSFRASTGSSPASYRKKGHQKQN